MTVIVLTNPTQYLRGTLAQYLLEIRANVFVGTLNARLRGNKSLLSAGRKTNSSNQKPSCSVP